MKTMELNPMTGLLSNSYVLVSNGSVENLKKVVKRHLMSVGKFLMYISPVYPQCTGSLRNS